MAVLDSLREVGRFIYDRPAFLMGDTLVLADLHLGIEADYRKKGVRLFHHSRKIASVVRQLWTDTPLKNIFLLGDVKHALDGTRIKNDISEFFRALPDDLSFTIVKGNHDGSLEHLLPPLPHLKIFDAHGTIVQHGRYSVFLFHGHAWPSSDIEYADIVLMGHTHPGVEFTHFGKKVVHKCWLVGTLDQKEMKKHGYTLHRSPLVIVFPSANDLAGCITNPQEFVGPLFENNVFVLERAYLLDAYEIGKDAYVPASF